VVAYERPLKKATIESFDLWPLDPMDPMNVRLVGEAWRKHVYHTFVENNELFSVVDQRGHTWSITMSTRPGVDFQVTMFDARMRPTGHLDFNDFERAADSLPIPRGFREKLVPKA
jgi:hypothetical protein